MTNNLEAHRRHSDFLAVPADAKAGRRIADLEIDTMAIVRRQSVVPYLDYDRHGHKRYGIAVRTNDEIPEHAEQLNHPVGVYNAEINLGGSAITGFVVDGRRADLFTSSRLHLAETLEDLELYKPAMPFIVSYTDNDGNSQQTANAVDRRPHMEPLAELEEWLDEFYDDSKVSKTEIKREEWRSRLNVGMLMRRSLPIATNLLAPEIGIPLLVAQEIAPHAVKAITRRIKR